MAGRPRCFLPLFGMGLRRFSMSPALLPAVKELARRSTLAEARRTMERALRMRTVGEIRGYLGRRVRQVWPHVTLLDTSK
jgi:phosphotransferase system enzyme I (PtsI)